MSGVVPYEQRLNENRRWALMEGSLHFEKESAVYRTMEKLARRLAELGVPYAVAGGMALFQHGYRRFTEDVHILITPDGLRLIHERLDGLGYVPPFTGSKNLRDTETGVRIKFLVTGGYPGDGQPKPVSFPDPGSVGVDIDGIRCINLPKLVELKLASGTAAWRLKDLADVQEMIRVFGLSPDFADQLDPSVRGKFLELLRAVREVPRQPE